MLFRKLFIILFFLIFSSSAFADQKMTLGLEVYNNKAQCGLCHTLQAAGSDRSDWPQFRSTQSTNTSELYAAVTNGTGVMPSWEGILTYEEIEAVAYYVFNSTNK